eukprot:14361164-Alexandrium_andersonii.AAC.1
MLRADTKSAIEHGVEGVRSGERRALLVMSCSARLWLGGRCGGGGSDGGGVAERWSGAPRVGCSGGQPLTNKRNDGEVLMTSVTHVMVMM